MFKEFKKSELTLKVNYKLIPVTMLGVEDIDKFNEVYQYILNQKWKPIERTPSGGIKKVGLRIPCFDARATTTSVEITVLSLEGCFRIQLRFSKFMEDKENNAVYGYKAFTMFRELCLKNGIDLYKYKIDNGADVKREIEKPLICFERPSYRDVTFENAHHIDFHNSYPAGLVNTHPEFGPVVEHFYKGRKEHAEYKAVLNLTVGYMQSITCCKAAWAHLSRDAINDNNRRIRELAASLRESGRMVLAYNTDGIWYTGEVYHGKGEGKELGQWENDHTECKIRFKSAGSYEYIENDIYKPVVRGKTKLDMKGITRDQWKWGDIYNTDAEPIVYRFIEGVGVKLVGEEE